MPTAAGRALLRAAEAAGQDRPDDASEAADGSSLEAADGRRVQKGSDGGANAGTAIENGTGEIGIGTIAGETYTEHTESTETGRGEAR